MCIIFSQLVSAVEPGPYACWVNPTPHSEDYIPANTDITIAVLNKRDWATPTSIFISLEGPFGPESLTNRTWIFTDISEATPVSYTFKNLINGKYSLWGYAETNGLTRPIIMNGGIDCFSGGNPVEKNMTNITIGPHEDEDEDKDDCELDIDFNSYTTTYTNQNITVRATAECGTLNYNSHTFTENGEFTFTATNSSVTPSSVSQTVKITNIDKTAPTATVTYSTTSLNKTVTATIHPSETLASNSKTTYTFTKNGTYIFYFEDRAGNEGNVTATVNNILVPTVPIYTPHAVDLITESPAPPNVSKPSVLDELETLMSDSWPTTKKILFRLATLTLLLIPILWFIRDRKEFERHCVYVMENLVETDTNNGNAKTFSNYIKNNCIETTFLTTPNKENKDINRIGDVIVAKEGKNIYNGGRAYTFPWPFLFRNRHDISHIWCYTSRASSFWVTLFKKLYGRKTIIKCDSVIPSDNPKEKPLRKLWQYFTIKWPWKNADLIIAESPRIKKIASRYNPNVIVMPNCVNIESIAMPKFRLAMRVKEKTIISIGRIEPIKGILDLVNAFNIFYKYHPDWKLRIIGPLTNKEYVLEVQTLINKLALQKAITIVGPKFGDDLYMEMAKAHTYCIASHPLGDGRNNTLPYAIYFGCQPVVTDVGDMKSIVNPIGIDCIKPQDHFQLAIGLEKALHNKKTQEEMEQYIKENLDWANYLPMLNNIFKDDEKKEYDHAKAIAGK